MNSISITPKRVLALGTLISALILLLCVGSADAGAATFKLKPKNNASVKGKTKVQVTIAKSLKKKAWGIEFWIDGERVATDRKAPYTAKIDTRKYENGEHIIRANMLVKAKGSKKPDPNNCSFTRVSYVNVKNKTVSVKPPKVPTSIVEKGKTWSLKFNDDFNGAALDTTKWNDQRFDWMTGGHPYNDREAAYYKPANTTVGGGNLVQTVKVETATDQYLDVYDRTTGMINGNQKFNFQYGYVEARVKVPACEGCWPVFWTLPSANVWPPEVDMFEFLDTASPARRPFMASHFGSQQDHQTAIYYFNSACGATSDYTGRYHTYGYLWTPKKIQSFIDGVPGPVVSGEAVPHVAMYLVMALQTVDKSDAGVKFNTPGGSQMFTDYIRVWQSNKP